MVALLFAFARQQVLKVRAARAAEAAANEAAIAPPSLRTGPRGTDALGTESRGTESRGTGPRASWVTAPTFRTAIGKTGPDGELLPNDQRPPDLFLKLDSQLTIPAVQVRLTWRAPGAEVVLISGLPGEQPPSGCAELTLLRTGDITVTASNAHGSRTERTALVRVLPMPTMTQMALPVPPSLMLGATIDVSLNWGEPVLAQLDALLGEHERQRLARTPQLPDHLAMAQIASSIRDPMTQLLGWRPVGPLWLTKPTDKPESTGPSAPQTAARWLTDQGHARWAGLRARAARPERPVPEFQPAVVTPPSVTRNVNLIAAPARTSTAYDHVTAKTGGWPQTSHDESRM